MSKKVKNVIKFFLTVLLLLVALLWLTQIFERKAAVKQYSDFFTQEEDFDVLFMGTSHVLSSVYPMELWKDYGIVSYNMGGNGNQLATTYWVMENALDYTTPKLVVIDCLKLNREFKTSTKYAQVHVSFDAFPLSKTKVEGVLDLLDEEEIIYHIEHDDETYRNEQRVPLGMLWNFSVYHARWEELEEEDFSWTPTTEKGAQGRVYVSKPQNVGKVDPNKRISGTVAESYLRKMIEDCQSRDIEVLLVYLPFAADLEEQAEANSIEDIAKEYGVNYVNCLEEDIVDLEVDMSDEDSHLNFSGGRKVTDFLGQYITEHYDIPDQRENPDFAFWDEDYAEYREYKISLLKRQTTMEQTLMLLADKNFNAILRIGDDSVKQNATIKHLLYNIGLPQSIVLDENKYLFETRGGETGESIPDLTPEGYLKTSIGDLGIHSDPSKKLEIWLYDADSGQELVYLAF